MSHLGSAPQQRWVIGSAGDLGRAIADIRTRQGMTQEQFAARAGLTRAYLAQIESGRSTRLLEHHLRLLRRSGAAITITLNPTTAPSAINKPEMPVTE